MISHLGSQSSAKRLSKDLATVTAASLMSTPAPTCQN